MRNIWVIAKNTISQAIRMKLALVLIVLLLVLLPLMSTEVIGDGTLVGKLQTFSSYGLSLTALLLSFLTITIGCFTLSNDIKQMQIFSVITKPVARFQIVVGKFLGVVIFSGAMLFIFSAAIYLLTIAMPRLTGADEYEVEQAQQTFFTARKGVSPFIDMDRITAQAREEYERLRREGELPEGQTRQQLINSFRGQMMMQQMSVEPGAVRRWQFHNLRPRADEDYIYLRFKYEVSTSPPDNMIAGRWVIGDMRQFDRQSPDQAQTPIYDSYVRRDSVRSTHEIRIPVECIAEDGYVEVGFQNIYYNNTTVIPRDIELLYRSGSFETNYIMASMLIFVRLVFLAALGVSLTTWLSFPVAIFACLVVFFTGMVNGFIIEALDALSAEASVIYSLTIRPVLSLLPKFDGDYNPTSNIVSASLIGWNFIFKAILLTAILKTGLMMLVGIFIFSKKEIAKITV